MFKILQLTNFNQHISLGHNFILDFIPASNIIQNLNKISILNADFQTCRFSKLAADIYTIELFSCCAVVETPELRKHGMTSLGGGVWVEPNPDHVCTRFLIA